MNGAAFVSDEASVGRNCLFGHGVVVEAGARIGDGVVLGHHVVVLGSTSLGEGVEVGPSAVLGKEPRSAPSSARGSGRGGVLTVGAGSTIGASAVLHNGTEFEENCYVGDLAAVREGCHFSEGALIGRHACVEEDVRVGRRSRIMTGAYITGGTTVGEGVFVGPMVTTTNDRYMNMWKDKSYAGPTIGSNAAIGAGAALLSGITVGEWAVIGMGAVVLTDVGPRRIFVGVPARDAGEIRKV